MSAHQATLLILLGVVMTACKSAPVVSTSSAPTKEHMERARTARDAHVDAFQARIGRLAGGPLTTPFVLIPHDAPFYHSAEAAAAGEDAPIAPYSPLSPQPSSTLSAFVLLSAQEDIVEVGILPAAHVSLHCVDPLPAAPLTHRFEVRLWVRKSSLVPVLQDTWTQIFEDGTAYALLPGNPVRPTGSLDGEQLHVGGKEFATTLSLKEASSLPLGLSYSDPSTRLLATRASEEPKLPSDAILWIEQKPLVRASELGEMLRFVRQQQRFDSQTTMVALASTCTQLAALAARTDVSRASTTTQSRTPRALDLRRALVSSSGEIVYWRHDPDTLDRRRPLYWEDGTRAGVLRGRRAIPTSHNMDEVTVGDKTLLCFELPLKIDSRLCQDARVVTRRGKKW